MRALPLILTAMIACEKGEDTGVPIPSTGGVDDTAVECGGVAPEISSLNMSDGDFQVYGDSEVSYPTVVLSAEVTDEDGDLDAFVMNFWWDTEIDGVVDSSGAPNSTAPGSSSALPCEGYELTLNGYLYVGTSLEPNTTYDVAVTVTDAGGIESDPAVTTGTTPKEDGSPGDGR